MKSKIKKNIMLRVPKWMRLKGEGFCTDWTKVSDGFDFSPKPEELKGVLKYMDELEARETLNTNSK